MYQDITSHSADRTDAAPEPLKRVLLVEDDASVRETLREALQLGAYTPSVAASFRGARLAVVAEGPFAVIVSDYHLPDGTGLELLDWLQRELQVSVPFLLISGGIPRLPAVGEAYEFLAKPFSMAEFYRCVERLSVRPVRPPPGAAVSLTDRQAARASLSAPVGLPQAS